ncbi:GntR family transcriptional regulator [Sinorhizobium fredii USDA 205]|uniref:FCD domain-containing protein n=1 Tax=Rhizobium fredii TaxID=380 RepID=A0A2A6LS44_RHIFR|nr:FadR/GntR family transcriptional regulator [Sinorhizobium fredii]ASY71711.1 Transcriptional regulator PhnF [Sinorhizobium fredii CCBAU 83666]AWM27886.1 Transcriptional regulator PhnF [Sinorhizobium fredii CCBAU 25509]KSV87607.1 GntR family transcriptional regulator [Sinorhizobium fredii USDA 205]MCG5474472.1 FadR family transcriptional regulator [Sinorhizobium fredii]MQW97244.1 FCD domain-containing protein [Sinorhizobium fredii]
MSVITQRGNLAEIVVAQLASRIDSGLYGPGDKLPSSAQLCEEFGVSRTVIREALTSLKVGGRVTARQGAGVFVTEKDAKTLNFEISRIDDIRSAMQILELRLGVELQSVALAASRRTPEALAEIARAYDQLENLDTTDAEVEAQADFDFHLAIAKATRNPHFPRFLEAVRGEISLDLVLKHRQSAGGYQAYLKKINKEHAAILAAITQGDVKGAKNALAQHLEESLNRYRAMLDEPATVAEE